MLQAFCELRHPTAEEVYVQVVRQHPAVSKGTVYRNLNLLASQGRLRRVEIPDGADRFDSTLAEHYHFCCRSCGKVFDVDLPYQSGLMELVENTEGFLFEGHDILFKGLCPACR